MTSNLSTWIPTRKVQASGIAGIIGSIVVVALHRWAHVDIDLDVVVPIVASLMVAISYAIPPAERDLLGKVDAAVKADAATGDPTHKALMQALLDAKETGLVTIPAGVTLPSPLTLQAPAAGLSPDDVRAIVARMVAEAQQDAAARATGSVRSPTDQVAQAQAQAQAIASQNAANAAAPATLPDKVYGAGQPQPA